MSGNTKRRGRKPWKPTKAARERVKTAAAMGLTVSEIARLERVDARTLRKHCPDELASAALRANAAVALALYKAAVGSVTGKPNARAAAFWLKCKAGWTEAKPPPDDVAKGVKQKRQRAAQRIAKSSSRFAPGAPPKLALAVDNTKPKDPTDDEPAK